MAGLELSVQLLESAVNNLESAVGLLNDKAKNVNVFNETLHTKVLFDVLPETLVLQKPLKIRKMVKPMLDKDSDRLDTVIERLRKRQLNLQQQSKLLKLKLESINN
ncbi:hypothetical protein CANINC_000391 [Pichia inconspicua]|uniref:Uncharacterized protein n=1 Tax=Pichia inconspicua TaxID=52247 RepID=A0A4V4NG86_9ASCO|nr:hypothetical protein CANINC_000391 [[Candida] inconspicua]